jgi:hypothetical protein
MMVVCSYLPLFYAVGANASREGMDVPRGAKYALSDHEDSHFMRIKSRSIVIKDHGLYPFMCSSYV